LMHRKQFRNVIKDTIDGFEKSYTKASQVEDLVKRTMYGRVKLSFSSNHFTDEIPWYPHPQSGLKTERANEEPDHIMDSPVYVRKYIEPSKFKKLSIPSWEMPESCNKTVSLQEMINAGMQYGHSPGMWNPKMLPFLYSEHEGTHIFDLVQSAASLNRACFWVMEAARKGAKIMWTGTKEQAGPIIKDAAIRTNSPYCDKRWVGGILTNQIQTKKGIAKMKRLVQERDQGAWEGMNKTMREKNELMINRFIKKYTGLTELSHLPDILIAVDGVKEKHAINEAEVCGIPVIALLDSNSNPKWIDFVVAGNASGTRSIDLFVSKLTEAIIKGRGMLAQDPTQEPIEKVFDAWMFSKERRRELRRRSKRQHFQKLNWGTYDLWKKAHPFGIIPGVAKFQQFSWLKSRGTYP